MYVGDPDCCGYSSAACENSLATRSFKDNDARLMTARLFEQIEAATMIIRWAYKTAPCERSRALPIGERRSRRRRRALEYLCWLILAHYRFASHLFWNGAIVSRGLGSQRSRMHSNQRNR